MDSIVLRNLIASDIDTWPDNVDEEDRIECVCSEGCQGISRTLGTPGLVVQMSNGQRFHVQVSELT